MATPSAYEARAREAIRAWRHPPVGWVGRARRAADWPLDKATDLVLGAPGVGWVLERSVGGLVSLTNDVAQATVRPEAIFAEYRAKGHAGIYGPEDLLGLDLEEVDQVIGYLAAKYKGLALSEGAAFGAMGLVGIPLDVVALVTLNLRALGEYAAYCGFCTAAQHERLFALKVLGLASHPADAGKTVALAQLVRLSQDLARKAAWKDLEQHAFVQVFERLAKALGLRLTKAKLAQWLPALGAVVGGGFNAYFTDRVCDAGYFLYRERFLAAKYGPEPWEPAPELPRREDAATLRAAESSLDGVPAE